MLTNYATQLWRTTSPFTYDQTVFDIYHIYFTLYMLGRRYTTDRVSYSQENKFLNNLTSCHGIVLVSGSSTEIFSTDFKPHVNVQIISKRIVILVHFLASGHDIYNGQLLRVQDWISTTGIYLIFLFLPSNMEFSGENVERPDRVTQTSFWPISANLFPVWQVEWYLHTDLYQIKNK